jgi:hypothetical protein
MRLFKEMEFPLMVQESRVSESIKPGDLEI